MCQFLLATCFTSSIHLNDNLPILLSVSLGRHDIILDLHRSSLSCNMFRPLPIQFCNFLYNIFTPIILRIPSFLILFLTPSIDSPLISPLFEIYQRLLELRLSDLFLNVWESFPKAAQKSGIRLLISFYLFSFSSDMTQTVTFFYVFNFDIFRLDIHGFQVHYFSFSKVHPQSYLLGFVFLLVEH